MTLLAMDILLAPSILSPILIGLICLGIKKLQERSGIVFLTGAVLISQIKAA